MTKHCLLIATLTLAGCSGSDPFTEYRNANNGARGNLDFNASTVTAIGDAATVLVQRREEGPYDCATYQTPLSLGGSSSVRCDFAGKLSPVEALTDAQCDNGTCDAVISSAFGLTVTGRKSGKATLTVTARLADGTVLTDSTTMYFVAVDGISVTCDRAYACPGPNAVFPGATFSWNVKPMSGGNEANGVVRATLEQPGIVELTGTSEQFTIRVLKAGVATIHLKTGTVERIHTVRVAAFDEIVAASVHYRRDNVCQRVICVDANEDILGEVAPQKTTRLAPTFILAWKLRDGTYAVGGAGRITSPTPGVEVLVAGRFDPVLPADLELTSFTVGAAGGILCHAGRNTLAATMGNAKLDWSFDQECQ